LTTTNYVLKANGTTIGNSLIQDDGSTTTITGSGEVLRLTPTGVDNYIAFRNSAGTQIGDIGYDGRDADGLSIWNNNASGNLVFGAGGSRRLTISSTGLATFSNSIVLSATGYVGFGGGNNYIEGDNANNILRFGTNNVTRVTINASGNLGIGTTSPTTKLSIGGTTDAYMNFAPTSFRNFIIGSDTLGFIVYDNNASAYRMVITSGGQVQIKQSANSHNEGLSLINTGNQVWNLVNGGDANFYFGYQGVSKANISPTTGVFTPLSDVNKKKDFEQSTIGLSAILGLKPTLYRMIDEEESVDKHLGFIAQEVKDFIPQAYCENINGDKTFIGLDYQAITSALVKAVQEQQALITSLQSQINELKNK
jgi:hypothetical protein